MARWKNRLGWGVVFIGGVMFIMVDAWLLRNPTSPWYPVLSWGLILPAWIWGCIWFVWNITSRWYPLLKKTLGLPRVYRVLVGLNALAWLPGFCAARYVLNSLTGVDAGNFPTALWVFTLGGIAYFWLMLIILCLGWGALKSMVMFFILGIWEYIRGFFWALTHWRLTPSVAPPRPLPVGRHLTDVFAFMCVLGLLGMVIGNATTRHAVKTVANIVLVATEFSYDHTCVVSNETRWVAPLKDRKEPKVSNVLIADVQSLTHVQFSVGHCA